MLSKLGLPETIVMLLFLYAFYRFFRWLRGLGSKQ